MTFGPGGPHFCTGAHLARLEIEIVFTEMVKRVASFELAGDARAPAVELLQRHQADAAAAHSRLSPRPSSRRVSSAKSTSSARVRKLTKQTRRQTRSSTVAAAR